MKWWQNIVRWFLWGLATFTAFGVPTWKLIDLLIIEHYDKKLARWSFAIALVLLVIALVSIKVIKAWYDRKLQSLDVADELGIVGTTPIIVKRVLLLIQVAFPLASFSLFMYGLQYIEIPSHTIFLDYLKWFIGGFFIYLFHDYVKRLFIVKNTIEKAYKLDVAKQKLADKYYKFNT